MNRGGAELRTLDVVRQLGPRRYTSHFCVLSGARGTLDEEIQALGGVMHYCRLKSPLFTNRFLHLLRTERFDVVHSHVHYASGFIATLAALAGVPTRVVHFRSSSDGRQSSLVRRVIRGMLSAGIQRCSTHIVGVSESTFDGTWRSNWRDDRRCQVIYNGLPLTGIENPAVSIREEFSIPADVPLVVHVGRMHEAKNHRRVVLVFAQLTREHPEARLLLVGRRQDRIETPLQADIEHAGLSGRVIFAGERTDVAAILSVADVLLFPSLWEGLPGAVLESLRAGTPVIASTLPVILEVARLLPGITPVDLQATDREWADAVWQAAMRGRDHHARNATVSAFRESPFCIRHTASQFVALWGTGARDAA
jgi:glycosyltransferase involved in cell wall biosynthesis